MYRWYNKSGKCKHIGVLVYYLNSYESISETSNESQWNKISAPKLAKAKYSKGQYFFEMFPPENSKLTALIPLLPIQSSDLKTTSALKVILEAAEKEQSDLSIENFLKSAEKNITLSSKIEECKTYIHQLINFQEQRNIYSNNVLHNQPEYLKNFFMNKIYLLNEDIINLSASTITQSQNDEWFDARKFGLSCSSNMHSIKTRRTKDPKDLSLEMHYSHIFFGYWFKFFTIFC